MLAAVAEVVHDKKGPDYQVDLKKMKHYNWKEMIAQLRDEDIEWVVNGDSNKGGGCRDATSDNAQAAMRTRTTTFREGVEKRLNRQIKRNGTS